MDTQSIIPQRLQASVIAVPPMARDLNRKICRAENTKIVRHIESGGVSTLLYGGNAMFYHLRPSEFASCLSMLTEIAGSNTLVVPSVGPAYGMMMDQAEVLRDFDFPTAMILPQREIADDNGLATGIRLFAESFGKPIVLYLKHDRWIDPSIVESLYRDGLISWIKYAVVRDNPGNDNYLREVLQKVPGEIIISGIGEQPAIIHMRDFGVVGYTSGCVCVAPKLSQTMLESIQAKDFQKAESIRALYEPLENLRNAINPIRVLHEAVQSAEIAKTGPMQPMLSELTSQHQALIRAAVQSLLELNRKA